MGNSLGSSTKTFSSALIPGQKIDLDPAGDLYQLLASSRKSLGFEVLNVLMNLQFTNLRNFGVNQKELPLVIVRVRQWIPSF